MLLLHLSDIHFKAGEIGSALDPNANLRNELVRDAGQQCRALGVPPDAVVISGDIAYAGTAAEYAFATTWLESLCEACETTLSKVFVVPGNHDVSRQKSGEALIQSVHNDIKSTPEIEVDTKLRELLQSDAGGHILYEPLHAYNTFAAQFLCDVLPPERTIAYRDLSLNDGSVLRICGMNSALISSAKDKRGDLFLDPGCFQILRQPGVENAVICHHPYEWLRQGQRLKDFLDTNARLHLFGHEHTNRITQTRDWVQVAASASQPEISEDWEPGYNLIDLKIVQEGENRYLEVRTHVRIWQQRPGQFIPKRDRNQSEFFYNRIALENWGPKCAPNSTDPKGVSEDDIALLEGGAESVDDMGTIRDVSVRFFRLTINQKLAIASKYNLVDESDGGQPDYERFRRVLLRAKERGLLESIEVEMRIFDNR